MTKPRLKFSYSTVFMLLAPLLIFAGVWWWQRQPLDPSQAVPPANWLEGRRRIIMNQWRVSPVTSVDQARGLTAAVECDVWLAGRVERTRGYDISRIEFDSERNALYLMYRRGQKWQRLTLADGTGGVRCTQTSTLKSTIKRGLRWRHLTARYLLPVGLIPNDVDEITLGGIQAMKWMEYGGPRIAPPSKTHKFGRFAPPIHFTADSNSLTLALSRLRGWNARPGDTPTDDVEPGVQLLNSALVVLPSARPQGPSDGRCFMTFDVNVTKPLTVRRQVTPKVIESRVTDSKGRVYSPSMSELFNERPSALKFNNAPHVVEIGSQRFRVGGVIDFSNIPASAGELTYTLWLCGLENRPPLKIIRTLRPKWITSTASDLRIDDIKVSKLSDYTGTTWKGVSYRLKRQAIDVMLTYLGNAHPRSRGYISWERDKPDQWAPSEFVDRYLKFPYLYKNIVPVKAPIENEEMLIDWSPRLTKEQRQTVRVPGGVGGNIHIQVEEPKHANQRKIWKLRYIISTPEKLRGAFWFRNEVGIIGKGFVPFECRIAVP